MKSVAPKSKPLIAADPSVLLKAVLAERCAKNPQYSIRSFARSSGISHTVLSLVLSGKRRLSKKAAIKLAEYLQMDPQQKNKFLKTYRAPSEDDFQTLSLDSFEVISDWYHYAILSLLELPDSKYDARWIAKQMGITILKAKLALERLERIGLIEKTAAGIWSQSGKPIKIDNSLSTAATRKFHKQLLKRAADSIDSDPIAVRDFSSMTFTLDPSQVEYARTRIREFRRALTAELEAKGTPSAVFNMTIQLYPVTKLKE